MEQENAHCQKILFDFDVYLLSLIVFGFLCTSIQFALVSLLNRCKDAGCAITEHEVVIFLSADVAQTAD